MDAAGAVNRLALSATIVERGVVRYTPSGVATIDCVLAHRSTGSEAAQPRQIELEMPAVAFEDIVHRLAACPLDDAYRFDGFLANRSRRSKRAVFHITGFMRLQDS